MICFRDMTYCSAECANADCRYHKLSEKKDRQSITHLKELETAWADFSSGCPEYEPTTPEAA